MGRGRPRAVGASGTRGGDRLAVILRRSAACYFKHPFDVAQADASSAADLHTLRSPQPLKSALRLWGIAECKPFSELEGYGGLAYHRGMRRALYSRGSSYRRPRSWHLATGGASSITAAAVPRPNSSVTFRLITDPTSQPPWRSGSASRSPGRSHPFRPNASTHHLGERLAYTLHQFVPLLLTEVPWCAGRVLRGDSVHRLDVGGTPHHQQGVLGPLVPIERERDLRVIGQRVDLRCRRRAA